MASAVRKTVANVTSTPVSDSLGSQKEAIIDPRDTAKYLLRVTAGPSYDPANHGQVQVNGDAFHVSNEFMTAIINVRIRDYHGLPRSSPSKHPYFSHPSHRYDRYSISFSFTPKKDIPGDELIMGFDFDRPIRDRLPPLFKPALKIVTTVIDPGIYCDAYSDTPYVYGPALSSFYILRIGDKPDINQTSLAPRPLSRESRVVQEGGDGSGAEFRLSSGIPENSEKRRKYYLKQERLRAFTFEEGREYEADFFNPYLDFANFALRLPGISISVAKYIDEKTHQLRYVLKNKRTGDVYFVVVLTLLFGQELKDALREEKVPAGEELSNDSEAPVLQSRSINEEGNSEDKNSAKKLEELDQPESLMSSLGKWIPKILRSGGTTTGSSTPDTERQDLSVNQQIDEMADHQVEARLRNSHGSVEASS